MPTHLGACVFKGLRAEVPAFQEQMKHSKELLEEELRAFTLDHPEMLTELKVGTMKLTTVKSEFWGDSPL